MGEMYVSTSLHTEIMLFKTSLVTFVCMSYCSSLSSIELHDSRRGNVRVCLVSWYLNMSAFLKIVLTRWRRAQIWSS